MLKLSRHAIFYFRVNTGYGSTSPKPTNRTNQDSIIG